jgi:hypothetical protein
MTISRAAAALAFTLSASAATAQVPAAAPAVAAPRFQVIVFVHGDATAEFNSLIADYSRLRSQLQRGLPPVSVSNDPEATIQAELALAALIREARQDAVQGDIFTKVVSVGFREAFRLVMTRHTWATIMDDNPGAFSHRINDTYSKKRTLATMPATILSQLPTLPEGLEYRFLGQHLILLDTRANMILDRIPYAIYQSFPPTE